MGEAIQLQTPPDKKPGWQERARRADPMTRPSGEGQPPHLPQERNDG